jgi:hypothetical protein
LGLFDGEYVCEFAFGGETVLRDHSVTEQPAVSLDADVWTCRSLLWSRQPLSV